MGWKIDVKGATLAEDEVLAAHVSVVNVALGTTGWDAIDPISSPEALVCWCALSVSLMTEKPLEESLMFIQQMPIQEVIGFFTAEAPVSPPEPSTGVEAAPGPRSSKSSVTVDKEQLAALQQMIANDSKA